MQLSATTNETFGPGVAQRWNIIQTGGGQLVRCETGLHLTTVGATRNRYADAQIDDYANRSRRKYPWRAPLQLSVRARASGPLIGTAGFGLWNNPFTPLGGFPRLPAALWFFYASPPSDLPLAHGVPGTGWKCATIDATTPRALRWAPFAPLVLLLNRQPRLAQHIWPRVQHDLAIAEQPIAPLDHNWRDYRIEWQNEQAHFYVDQKNVFTTPFASTCPLGFVAWIDNQYAIATPQGQFAWGLLDAPRHQFLELNHIRIEHITG